MPAVRQVLTSERLGGGELVALQLATAARSRGWGSSAWVPGAGPAANALRDAGVPARQYDLDALRRSNAAQLMAWLPLLPDLVLRRSLIHIHAPAVFGLLRPLLRATGARVIVHVHLEQNADEIAWLLKAPPDRIVTCAHYLEARLRSAGGTAVSTVQNAVDTGRFVPGDRQAARARAGLTTDRFVVLMLANLAPHKGQITAIRAIASLAARGVNVEGWLVGEDREPGRAFGQSLRDLASSAGVADRVKFLGFRTDAPDLLQAADVLVLPSTHEGLPLSILEAQSAGVPVIGSNIPGILEVIDDGRTGFVVAPDDHAGYAERISQLCLDPAVRAGIVTRAADTIARDHRRPVMEDRMFAVYDEVSRA